jgi:hypothetical protein
MVVGSGGHVVHSQHGRRRRRRMLAAHTLYHWVQSVVHHVREDKLFNKCLMI